ncbi:RNA-directed DNA polymerase, eukaryota [Tanacetum coccineum]
MHENHKIQELREKVEDFDIKAETTNGLENNDIIEHLSLMKELEALEHIKRMDLMQKSEVKCCIDGDENYKFFHGMINNKLSRSRIKGITINGSWETYPSLVISHIFNFHKQKFQSTSHNRPCFSSNLFKTLTNLDVAILDAPFSCDKIKEAVWNCGGSRASGPDGFTFKFIKHYWDSIGQDFINMVKQFELDGFILRGTDISKITRKPSKTGKHGHENGRVNKSRKPKPEKVKSTVNSSSKIGDIDINTLTLEQYLELALGNQAPGVVKPKIRNNVNFEIKSQFMRELREDANRRTSSGSSHGIAAITRTHLNMDCSLNEEVKGIEEVRYDEFGRSFPNNGGNGARYRMGPPRCFAVLRNQLPPTEKDPGSFILPCSIGNLTVRNAIVDLEARVRIMPLSMYKRLGLRKLKPVNMTVERADRTKSIPKGIVENLLVKTDKFTFPVNCVILDMVEDYRMPIILGRPLLATAHDEIDVFRILISLEVGNEKLVFKIEDNFNDTLTPIESVCALRNIECIMEDDLLKVDHDVFKYNSASFVKTNEFNYLLVDVAWEGMSFKDWMRVSNGKVDKMTEERIWKDCWKQDLKDDSDCENEEKNFRDERMELILDVIEDRLNDDWFTSMTDDEDDLVATANGKRIDDA